MQKDTDLLIFEVCSSIRLLLDEQIKTNELLTRLTSEISPVLTTIKIVKSVPGRIEVGSKFINKIQKVLVPFLWLISLILSIIHGQSIIDWANKLISFP